MGIEYYIIVTWQRELRRSVSAVSTEPVMELPSVKSSRSSRLPSALSTSALSLERNASREKVSVSGNASTGKKIAGGAWMMATAAAITAKTTINRLRRLRE